MTRRPWPNPADTTLDRSRFIARTWRELALKYAPAEACAALDRAATEFGETWVCPQPDNGAEWLTRDEAAALAGVAPDTISQWTTRGEITRYPEGYMRTQIENVQANRRVRRSAKRAAQLDL